MYISMPHLRCRTAEREGMLNSRVLKFSVILVLLVTTFSYGQSTDLLRLEYTHIPDDVSEVETSRYRFLINMPFKLKGGK